MTMDLDYLAGTAIFLFVLVGLIWWQIEVADGIDVAAVGHRPRLLVGPTPPYSTAFNRQAHDASAHRAEQD
ncbi:hypothetical protein [Phenylobacterium ferrooxidans]|uniref:Uncharacterized protein n=1 Tax=Phenylobacterium ferrooxidans TaxID=2982689 RepID=A0ABW6CMP8_9CAUL